jgi:hypothetical protein
MVSDMHIIAGLALVAISFGAFWASLPRNGKTARFVGTEWEGYIVAAFIAVFGTGLVLLVGGLAQMQV